jgi:hypothetical protein
LTFRLPIHKDVPGLCVNYEQLFLPRAQVAQYCKTDFSGIKTNLSGSFSNAFLNGATNHRACAALFGRVTRCACEKNRLKCSPTDFASKLMRNLHRGKSRPIICTVLLFSKKCPKKTTVQKAKIPPIRSPCSSGSLFQETFQTVHRFEGKKFEAEKISFFPNLVDSKLYKVLSRTSKLIKFSSRHFHTLVCGNQLCKSSLHM